MFGIDKRAARAVWTAALVVGLLYCIYTVRTTLLAMVFAVFFSYLVYPLVELLQARLGPRVPRDAVLGAVFVLVIAALAVAGSVFGSQVASEAASLGQQLPALLDPATLAQRLPLPALLEPFRDRLAELLRSALHSGQAQALPAAQRLGAGILHAAGYLIYVVVVPIFSFLMIRAAPQAERQLAALGGTHPGLWSKVARDLNFLLSRYVRALGLLSLAALVVYGTVLSLLGVQYALLLAVFAGALEVIPVFGPLVGATAMVAVAAFSGYAHVWWLVAFVAAYRVFQDYMLNPWLMSEGVDVPPILVVFGLLAGDQLAGVAGIFLSVPLIAAARIVASRVRAARAAAATSAAAATPAAGQTGSVEVPPPEPP